MKTTVNYGFNKPDGTDVVNVDDFNYNADKIDLEIKNLNDNKQDKVAGKGLSTNDYTTAEKNKLAGIATGANNYAHPSSHPASIITQDANNRFVTDSEKTTWNSKETTSGAQTKANTAESNAKAYTDTKIAGVNTDLAQTTTILTATGTANAITLDITLQDKKKYSFKAIANSTGAVTINGKAFKKSDGTQIGSGGVKSGKAYDFYYDATANSVFILAKAEGDALVGHVLAGKYFSNGDDTGLVGTMPKRGGEEYPAWRRAIVDARLPDQGRAHFSIPLGAYLDPNPQQSNNMGIFVDDVNFVSSNILSGKSIFGLAGSLVLGKKWANGEIPDRISKDSDRWRYYIGRVSGLSFKPKVIFVWERNYNRDNKMYWRLSAGYISDDITTSGKTGYGFDFIREYTNNRYRFSADNDYNNSVGYYQNLNIYNDGFEGSVDMYSVLDNKRYWFAIGD